MAFSHDPTSVLCCHRSQSPQQTENNRPARIVSSSVTSKRGFRYHGGRTMNPDLTFSTYWNLDSIQPVHKAELNDDKQCGGEVQPSDLPSAQCSVEACFPGVAHRYTCSRGAARLKNRNAATTTAISIPNNTVSSLGLRL